MTPDTATPTLPAWLFKHVKKRVRFFAMDSDGEWCGYTERPIQGQRFWIPMGEYHGLHALDLPAHPNWKQSLIERPKGVKE